jgi:hypothetical protein
MITGEEIMIRNTTRSAVALAGLVALSACGGGGGGVGASAKADFGATYSSFAEMEDRAEIIGGRYENSEITPMSDMPTSGSATYTGLAGFGPGDVMYLDEDDITVASEARLQADFGRGVLSGELTNFQAYDGTAISGSADITDGVIIDNQFAANVSGNVSSNILSGRLDGDLVGGFLGDDAQGAGGLMDIDVIEANGGRTTFGGALLVERD